MKIIIFIFISLCYQLAQIGILNAEILKLVPTQVKGIQEQAPSWGCIALSFVPYYDIPGNSGFACVERQIRQQTADRYLIRVYGLIKDNGVCYYTPVTQYVPFWMHRDPGFESPPNPDIGLIVDCPSENSLNFGYADICKR